MSLPTTRYRNHKKMTFITVEQKLVIGAKNPCYHPLTNLAIVNFGNFYFSNRF